MAGLPNGRTAAASVGAAAKMFVIPAAFFALFATTRIGTSGATMEELARVWPGDELVPQPALVWTNAVTIERPASEVWPWVTQIGQGRGGFYGYDWLENLFLADVHSVSAVVPALQRPLKAGDRVIRMARYAPYAPVARYDAGSALVLGGANDSPSRRRTGHPSSTWAFIVDPVDSDRCRLVVRFRAGDLAARMQGPIRFVMQRRMMLGIKQRAEGTRTPAAADVLIPLSWFMAAAAAAGQGARALRRGRRSRDLLMAGLAGIGVQVLLFWDVPPALRAPIVAALASPLAGAGTGQRGPSLFAL